MKLWKTQAEHDHERVPYDVTFPVPLPPEQVQAFFTALSTSIHRGPIDHLVGRQTIAVEAVATGNGIAHRLLIPWGIADHVTSELRHLIPGTIVTKATSRPRPLWTDVAEIHLSDSTRTIRQTQPLTVATDVLTSLGQVLGSDEMVMMQWVIAPAGNEVPPSHEYPVTSTKHGLWSQLAGTEAGKTEIDDRRTKLEHPRYHVMGRIASRANTVPRSKQVVNTVLAALKTANGHAQFYGTSPSDVEAARERTNHALTPWHFPASLNAAELTMVAGLPLGTPTTPGLPRQGSRHLFATSDVARVGRILGMSNYPGDHRPIAQGYDVPMHAAVTGKTGCLHPDTPIYDPVDQTTRTVKQRYLVGLPFYVFAMRGQSLVVAQAEPPVEYRKVGMYRLYNDDGQSVVVTGQHRVWNGSSYVEVDSLYSQQQAAPVRLPTISESALSRLQQDALHSMRTHEDSQDGYHPSDHLCDQPLRQVGDSDQASVQQPTCADVPCSACFCEDDLGNIQGCSHLGHERSRPPKRSSFLPLIRAHGSRLVHRGIDALDSCRAQVAARLAAWSDRSRTRRQLHPSWLQSSYRVCLVVGRSHWIRKTSRRHFAKLRSCELSPLGNPLVQQFHEFPVVSPQIVSPFESPFSNYSDFTMFRVIREQDETYYDFHVPVYENYLACGLIHHNTGKSVFLANSIAQDMARGFGAIIIDASNSNSPETLFNRALNYIPRNRLGDVVIMDIAASHDRPVGFNLLDQGHDRLVIDQLANLIQHLYPDSQGVWTRELIYHGMFALIEHGNATLIDLLPLLRPRPEELPWVRSVIKSVKNPQVKFFMNDWMSLTDEERRKRSQPLYDRLWQLNNRPEVHDIFGQTHSAFQLREVLMNNGILFINLAGLPDDTAGLIGTLLFQALWTEAQSLTPGKPNFIYLDEVQTMTKVNIGLSDIMERGRKHQFFLTAATQHITEHLSDETRTAMVSNTGAKVLFTTTSSKDAKFWAHEIGGNRITDYDIQNLPRFDAIAQIATSTGPGEPVTFTALAPFKSLGTAQDAIELSARKHGTPIDEVQQDIDARRQVSGTGDKDTRPMGRRKIDQS